MYLLAGYILIVLSTLVLAGKTVRMEKEVEKNRFIQSYMVSLQGFYETIQGQIEETRKFRHDLAKHIQTLEVLMKEDEASDLQQYADGLKEEYRKVVNRGKSENEVINAILSMKSQQCQEKGIPFFIDVEDKGYAQIRDMDMVGILMNLLDNAIEENEKIEDRNLRGIWIEMKENEWEEVHLQVKNRIRSGRKIDFQTEKKKKEDHGIGRRIIEYLVKQYQGEEEVCIDQQTSTFCETVLLKNRRSEDVKR